MKKVLIITPALHHGGTNRSLYNFLSTKNSEKYAVEILAMDPRGVYKERFSRFGLLPGIGLLEALFPAGKETGISKLKRIWYKIIFKTVFRGNKGKVYAYVARSIPKKRYDMIVAFQEGMATEFASYLPAKKRIAWVRCDYSNYLRLAGKSEERGIYRLFDKIVCVSQYTAQVFAGHYPDFADRVCSIYNIIDADGIITASRELVEDEKFDERCFTIVSVGRMDAVKRFTCIPEIARRMKENGCDFKWYIIGDGGTEESKVRSGIDQNGVAEQVIMLGSRENPYPYIARADLLVCPSYTEACPNVVNEAKILHVPVVAADFPSAPEYIESEVNGMIVPIQEMAQTILRIYGDKGFYKSLKTGISSFVYDNGKIRCQLDCLFG